jgi:undecaprenyl-diphosphatase
LTIGGFFITAGLLFSLSFLPKSKPSTLTPANIILLGLAQGVALLPGISRFAITYTTTRWLAIPHRRAFEISFLIQVPLIAAAFLKSLLQIRRLPEKTLLYSWKTPLIVTLAIIVGYFCLALAQRLAAQNKLWKFGMYVLAIGLLLAITV